MLKKVSTVEYDWPIDMPTCRSVGEGSYEIRSNFSDGNIARILSCLYIKDYVGRLCRKTMLLLYSFIKRASSSELLSAEIEISVDDIRAVSQKG